MARSNESGRPHLGRALLCVAIVLTAAAFATSHADAQCVGDCLGDGQATVDELITMANIALGKAPVTMCKSGDADHNGRMTVDEIVTGGNHALGGCPVIVSPQLEKAAGVVSSTLLALLTLLTAIPVFTSDTNGAAVPAATMPRVTQRKQSPLGVIVSVGGGAAPEPCPDGGTLDSSCLESGSNSTITASWSNCRIPDSDTGLVVTYNGTFVVVVASLGVCENGVIPGNVRTTTHFIGFSATSAVTSISLPDLTETVEPTGQGCAGPNGPFSLDGSFTVTASEVEIDLSGTAGNLSLQNVSSGVPCVAWSTANGSLDLDDRGNDRRFSASFPDTRATFQEGPDGTMLGSLDGRLDVNCVGDMTLTTDVPLELPGGGCPLDGRMSVMFTAATNGRIHFTTGGGVEFDYNGDGTPDKVILECHDTSISQCRMTDVSKREASPL